MVPYAASLHQVLLWRRGRALGGIESRGVAPAGHRIARERRHRRGWGSADASWLGGRFPGRVGLGWARRFGAVLVRVRGQRFRARWMQSISTAASTGLVT